MKELNKKTMKKEKINWRIVFIVNLILFAITWPLNYKNFEDFILRIIFSVGVLIFGFKINKVMKAMDKKILEYN